MDSYKYDYRHQNIEIDRAYEREHEIDNDYIQKDSTLEKVIQDQALFRSYESKPIKELEVLRSRLGPFQTYVFDRLRGLEPPDIAREVAKEESVSFKKAFARVHRALRIIREKAKLIG